MDINLPTLQNSTPPILQIRSRFVDVLVPHLPLALCAGGILLVASLVPLNWIPTTTCGFKTLTGYPCPFCGLTRAFSSLGHGHVRDAFVESPMGILLYALVVVVFAVSAYALLTRQRISPAWPAWLTGRRIVWSAAIVLLANWIYRLSSGRG